MALFWFDKLGHICPNHHRRRARERGQPEEAHRCAAAPCWCAPQPIPVEAVVRGYLAGSGWKEYQQSQSVCGVPCRMA